MLHAASLQDLRLAFSEEQDSSSRQDILDRWLVTVQEQWKHLFEIMTEEDPARLRLLVLELIQLLEARRMALATLGRAAEARVPSPASAAQEEVIQ